MDSSYKTIVVLPNIRSAYNVGSIFRTCDAAGVDEIYLVGYTPDPVDRFGRDRADIAKAALGAEKTIPWQHFDSFEEVCRELKNKNFALVAVEQDERAIDYRDYTVTRNTAWVFGNEVAGLEKKVIDQCDVVVEIPMRGEKESLNVSVAAGVVLFNGQ